MTTSWSGHGLPPAASARLAELKSGGSWGSDLGVSEFAAISRVGFSPVGQVLGAAVYNVGDAGDEECPFGGVGLAGVPGLAGLGGSGSGGGWAGRQRPSGVAALGSARPLVATLYRARRSAIDRMLAECTALGGHGVVGVSLTVGEFPAGGLEFRAFGTAVKGAGARAVSRPFASDLSGQDFTKLVAYGWIPVGLALGVAVGFRHDDWLTAGQTRWSAGNVEVTAYTDLVGQVRADARNELQLDLLRMGAEGVVVRGMELKISERSCPSAPGKDHVAEATMVGTGIAEYARPAPPAVYPVLTLTRRRAVVEEQPQVALRAADAEDEAEKPVTADQPDQPDGQDG
jgi:uncharacterized protein YbjQ (UPF0145 family)